MSLFLYVAALWLVIEKLALNQSQLCQSLIFSGSFCGVIFMYAV